MSYDGSYLYSTGGIEVICGPMFSGKTEELICRIKRARIGRQKIQVFKPVIDNRYDESDIVSHSSQIFEAVLVESSIEILQKVLDSTRIVAIDEVQFFDETILKVISKLARRGVRVICAGLDQDYRGVPFGQMAELLCIADTILKVHAICTVCGAAASKTYRKEKVKDVVLIGESDLYEARCREHFDYVDEEEDFLAFSVSLTSLEDGKRENTNEINIKH